jgi:hypothetical protein
MSGELIETPVLLSSKTHKQLTNRAERLACDRAVEGGRLVHSALATILARAEAPPERTYSQADMDRAAAWYGKRVKEDRARHEREIETLKARIAELEARP